MPIKNIATILLIFFSCLTSFASHIVGGEIQMTKLSTTNHYMFIVILYFDDVNGAPSAEAIAAEISIYSKQTNKFIESFSLNTKTQQYVNYTNNGCTINKLKTRQIQYSKEVILDPNKYNESAGYYVSWSHCCRNSVINNILSPGSVNMVYYMEFPPLSTSNSSPKFNIPKGDYVCRNDFFYFDFSAVDPDGDQLVYTMANPLTGSNSIWVAGYSANNAIPGNPPLKIDRNTGQMTVKASSLGLFVFSVICEEYRNGVKIGQVNRDYQLLVIDCPYNNPPVVQVREKGKLVNYKESDTLYITSQDARCFDVIATDPDLNNILTVTTNAINFKQTQSFLPNNTTLPGGSSGKLNLCFPECTFPDPAQRCFIFDVILSDNGCPIPKRDTVRITLVVIPEPNAKPVVNTSLGSPKVDIVINKDLTFNVIGYDADNDNINIEAFGRGFDLKDLGVNFSKTYGKGNLVVPFTFNQSCDKLNNNLSFQYIIDFVITDNSRCTNKKDTVSIEINLKDDPIKDELFIPNNVFTPNGDGLNDVFYLSNIPENTCLYFFRKVQIYNRWGNLVFEDTDKNFKWHGTTATPGLYYYYLDFGIKTYKGSLTVIK